MKPKLSERARLLLYLVNRRTTKDENGELTGFFVPSQHLYFYGNGESTYVYGGGDASAFKGLERKGLIKRPKTTINSPYVYEITKRGAELLETFRKEFERTP